MKHLKLGCLGCLLVPVILVGGFCGKVAWDAKMYDLPGPILKSNAPATQKLVTASEVAELLDAYVQPRFEILRDKDFGVSRIATTYLKHAGLAQLKVDTHAEKALIANVNAANRDYAIYMLHCAPKPGYEEYYKGKQLQILYFNQEKLIADEYYSGEGYAEKGIAKEHGFDVDSAQKLAVSSAAQLMQGEKIRTSVGDWDILMVPVLARTKECLSCHKEARLGDALGAMVYAVRKTPRITGMKVSSR